MWTKKSHIVPSTGGKSTVLIFIDAQASVSLLLGKRCVAMNCEEGREKAQLVLRSSRQAQARHACTYTRCSKNLQASKKVSMPYSQPINQNPQQSHHFAVHSPSPTSHTTPAHALASTPLPKAKFSPSPSPLPNSSQTPHPSPSHHDCHDCQHDHHHHHKPRCSTAPSSKSAPAHGWSRSQCARTRARRPAATRF